MKDIAASASRDGLALNAIRKRTAAFTVYPTRAPMATVIANPATRDGLARTASRK